jgi:hypothetical protein
MDVPVLPEPAEQPAEPDAPAGPPRPGPALAVIAGGGETTKDRGELHPVPDHRDGDGIQHT